jgi:hypothetical protein
MKEQFMILLPSKLHTSLIRYVSFRNVCIDSGYINFIVIFFPLYFTILP